MIRLRLWPVARSFVRTFFIRTVPIKNLILIMLTTMRQITKTTFIILLLQRKCRFWLKIGFLIVGSIHKQFRRLNIFFSLLTCIFLKLPLFYLALLYRFLLSYMIWTCLWIKNFRMPFNTRYFIWHGNNPTILNCQRILTVFLLLCFVF